MIVSFDIGVTTLAVAILEPYSNVNDIKNIIKDTHEFIDKKDMTKIYTLLTKLNKSINNHMNVILLDVPIVKPPLAFNKPVRFDACVTANAPATVVVTPDRDILTAVDVEAVPILRVPFVDL